MAKREPDDSGVDRRTMLKGAGAGLGTVGGFGSVVQSALATRTPTDEELDRLESEPKVQTVLSELGLRRIPNRDTAEVRELDGDGFEIAMTTVEFSYGKLQVGRMGGKLDAAFAFEGAAGDAPGQYGRMPEGVRAWLTASSETDTEFIRTATDRERDRLLAQVPTRDTEHVFAYTGTVTGGDFWIDVLDDDALTAAVDTADRDPGEGVRFIADAASVPSNLVTQEFTDRALTGVETTVQKTGAVSEIVQEVLQFLAIESLDAAIDGCGDEMLDCSLSILFQIPSCLKCAPACTAGMGISGGALCFLCVFGICSWMLTGYSCINAVDCLTGSEKVPDPPI